MRINSHDQLVIFNYHEAFDKDRILLLVHVQRATSDLGVRGLEEWYAERTKLDQLRPRATEGEGQLTQYAAARSTLLSLPASWCLRGI